MRAGWLWSPQRSLPEIGVCSSLESTDNLKGQQDNKILVHEGDARASASPRLATCVEAREGLEVRATREGEGRVAVKSSIISGGGKSEILG